MSFKIKAKKGLWIGVLILPGGYTVLKFERSGWTALFYLAFLFLLGNDKRKRHLGLDKMVCINTKK